MDFFIKAVQLLLSLSILVVLHEFGHYLAARYFGIRVEKFYLFFNPWFSLFKKKIGETEWGIGWLPLGGYVKISGMIDESMDKEQLDQPVQPWEFRSKPAWQRLIVMIGGVVVNLIVGVLIYIFVVFSWGEEQIHTADLKAGLSIHPYMQKYNLHSGDNILEIEGEKVIHINDINAGLMIRDQHTLKVQHADGKIEVITLPEGLDYEIFGEGAFPTTKLRIKANEISYLYALESSDSLGIKSGDIFLTLNNQPFSINNWSSENNQGTVLRDKDTLTIKFEADSRSQFSAVNPGIAAGLQSGDQITSINGNKIEFFDNIQDALYFAKNDVAEITFLRDNKEQTLTALVSEKGTIGFSPVATDYFDKDAFQHIDYSFGQSLSRGLDRGVTTLSDYVGQLKFVFTKKGASSISGFGGIGNLFPSTWNWEVFWLNTALISIILAFMNILPIPALDGGHVVFLLYEIVTGKEAPQKVLEYAQMVGFFILMGLMLYANGNDIYRYFFS